MHVIQLKKLEYADSWSSVRNPLDEEIINILLIFYFIGVVFLGRKYPAFAYMMDWGLGFQVGLL